MKTKLSLLVAVVLSFGAHAADAPNTALQKGLFEEEANQNLDAAIAAYQSLLAGHEDQRKLAATALFRLGECYRKLNRTNDAVAQYQRVVRDFADQTNLVTLSRQNLVGLGANELLLRAAPEQAGGRSGPTPAQLEAHRLLIERLELEIKSKGAELARQKELIKQNLVPQSSGDEIEARLLDLRRQLILARDAGPASTKESAGAAGMNALARAQLKDLLQSELKIAEQFAAEQRKRVENGTLALGDQVRFERDVLGLKRQLIATDGLSSTEDRQQWRELLLQEINLAEEAVKFEKAKLDAGRSVASEVARLQRDVLILKRELVTFDATPVQAASFQVRLQEIVARASTGGDPSNQRLQEIIDAASTDEEEKELRQIKAIIRDSPDLINAKAGNGWSRLQNAANRGQVKVAEFLLANGADVNANLAGRGTPLHLAAEHGHKTMTELLLRHGAEVNNRDPGGTPLHYAIENGHKAVAEVLIANKADVNSKGNGRGVSGDLTPLHLAAFKGFTTIAELLLAKGAQVNSRDGGGQTPLHYAATYGHLRVAQVLLANKAEVNARDNDGRTPLHSAVFVNQGVMRVSDPVLIARLLLENHAEVNARISRGEFKDWTPLHLAAKSTDRAMTELLLAHKPDVDALTPYSQTPLILAAANGKTEVVEALLIAGADVNIQTSDRATALGMAASKNDERMVSAILSRKPDLEVRNKEGFTPLQDAVYYRWENVVEPLLRAGANPNVSHDRDGTTLLHWAVANQQKLLVKLLLAHQADVNARNHYGQTPLDFTKAKPSFVRKAADQLALDDIGVLLVEAGADEQLQRRTAISISRRSRDFLAPWFVQGSNTWNRFTLLELIAGVYAQAPPIGFPDFTRVTINRLGAGGSKPSEIVVNVDSLLNAGDCSKDVPLEWGDVVEIPERDRKLNEQWSGLGLDYVRVLKRCLDRKVEIVVKGEPTKLTLSQTFLGVSTQPASTPQSSAFWLNPTVRGANVLRASSDLRRVKVRRTDPSTQRVQEIILNLEKADPRTDLWLRDGDVIEVPEKSGDNAVSSDPAPENNPPGTRAIRRRTSLPPLVPK